MGDDEFIQNLFLLHSSKRDKAKEYKSFPTMETDNFDHFYINKIDKTTLDNYEKFYNTSFTKNEGIDFSSDKFQKTITSQIKFLDQSIKILNQIIESSSTQIDKHGQTFIELNNFISSLESDKLIKFPPEITSEKDLILITISKIKDREQRAELLTPTLDLFLRANTATNKLISYTKLPHTKN